jgi:hypothetical protein
MRAAVLNAEPLPGSDLGTMRRRGLTTWLKGLIPEPSAKAAHAKPEPASNTSAEPTPNGVWSLQKRGDAGALPAASELTRVIAGIVIALTEPAYA